MEMTSHDNHEAAAQRHPGRLLHRYGSLPRGGARRAALGPDICRQGHFRRGGPRHRRGQPRLEGHASTRRAHRLDNPDPGGRRGDDGRQDPHRRADPRHPGRKRPLRHAGEHPRAGPRSGRLLQRFGSGGGRQPGGLCPRLRYWWLGPHPRQLLRPLRTAAHARAHPAGRHPDAGPQLRHHRLVRPRRRNLRAGCRSRIRISSCCRSAIADSHRRGPVRRV